MITDGVREPSGNNRHRGAGRPRHLPSLPATPSKRCRGADSPSSLGIPRYRLHRRPTWPGLGSAAPVREHDTRGNGGGFAPLEAFCRRVAGVSRLYWCNSPVSCPGMKGVAPKPQAPRRPQSDSPRHLAPRSTPKPPPPRHNGGFCTTRSLLSACRRRVAPLMVQIPPFAGSEVAVRGGEVTVRGGVAPTSPATSATNADNGVSWAKWSALWTQRRLAARVARTRTRYCER